MTTPPEPTYTDWYPRQPYATCTTDVCFDDFEFEVSEGGFIRLKLRDEFWSQLLEEDTPDNRASTESDAERDEPEQGQDER